MWFDFEELILLNKSHGDLCIILSESILKNTREIEFSRTYPRLSYPPHPLLLERPFFLEVLFPEDKIMLKVNKICPKLTIKTPEQR